MINEYMAKIKIIHLDCYKEKNIKRWISIGINDYMIEENILIIEWPEILFSILPDDIINIDFEHKAIDKRKITLI